jgi:hypothetical protein
VEHRHSHRRAVDIAVTVRTRAGLVGNGRINEASASGARLEIALPLRVHSIIALTLTLHRTPLGPKRSKLEAEIVRRSEQGFGIEWTEFMPSLLQTLSSGAATPDSQEASETPAEVTLPRRKARRPPRGG